MIVRVVKRESRDRIGARGYRCGHPVTRWALEEIDGSLTTTTYYDTAKEAHRARRELERGAVSSRSRKPAAPATPRRQTKPNRPAYILGGDELPFGYDASEVVLERGHASVTVKLAPQAQREIEDERRRVCRDAGREIEAGGWLLACYRPRTWSTVIEIAHTTWAGPGAVANENSFVHGDPYAAQAELPDCLRWMSRVGDWHSHPGGTLTPSPSDLQCWARRADELGISHYIGVLVAPAAEGGWTYPRYSAWVVERVGIPARPICREARLEEYVQLVA
jgi:Prokaryotic homologs of the JAB domain